MKLNETLYVIAMPDGTTVGPICSEVPTISDELQSIFDGSLRVATVVVSEVTANQIGVGSKASVSITIRHDSEAEVITRTDATGDGEPARRADHLAKVAYDAIAKAIIAKAASLADAPPAGDAKGVDREQQ
jgi:hypothetical protein